MPKMKKTIPAVSKRKSERRKPGDRRFPGRLIGIRKDDSRKGNRRSANRRKK